MIEIPWYAKIIVLLLGLLNPFLGIFLIILDSHFHITSTLNVLKKSSPDWIILRLIFGMEGFSEKVHKIMGWSLLIGSVLGAWKLLAQKPILRQFPEQLWFDFVQPATLIIIASAILFKNLALINSGLPPDNAPVAFF